MSTTPAGLQRQINALQLFCEQRQLTVSLAKTKVVTFGSRARCQTFTFNGKGVERVQSYKYLGFEFRTTKNLSHGVSKLVSAANKAMHAMNCRCAFLHTSDPKQRCKKSPGMMPAQVEAGDRIVGAKGTTGAFLTAWYCPFLVMLVKSGLLTKRWASQQSNCIGNF